MKREESDMKFIGVFALLLAHILFLNESYAQDVECKQKWVIDQKVDGEFQVPLKDYVLNHFCESERHSFKAREIECREEFLQDAKEEGLEDTTEKALSFLLEHVPDLDEDHFRSSFQLNPQNAFEDLIQYMMSSEDLMLHSVQLHHYKVKEDVEYVPVQQTADLRYSGGLSSRPEEVLSLLGKDHSENHIAIGGFKGWFYPEKRKVSRIHPAIVLSEGQEPRIVLNYVKSNGSVETFEVFPIGRVEKTFYFFSSDGKIQVRDRFQLDCRTKA
jgi:hypothetical protein